MSDKLFLGLVEIGAFVVYDAFAVDHHDIFGFYSQHDVELGAGDSRSSGSVYDDTYIFDFFTLYFEGVEQSGTR